MTDTTERVIDSQPAPPSWLLEKAINNLSLGLVIFDRQRGVVFCNKRYMEIYGLSSDQVMPGTPISELIQHRLDLGHKVPSNSDEYIRERFAKPPLRPRRCRNSATARTIIFTISPDAGRRRDGHP